VRSTAWAPRKFLTLEQAVARYQQGETPNSRFLKVESYAKFHWDHMAEEEVLPLAQSTTPRIGKDRRGVSDHDDPMFGTEADAECRNLFRRIVTLAPLPSVSGRCRSDLADYFQPVAAILRRMKRFASTAAALSGTRRGTRAATCSRIRQCRRR
jgi:hypothetical protein